MRAAGPSCRVVGGEYRGRRITIPKGLRLRPTSDRVKESLFSMLTPYVAGARFLDLCAGIGTIGIEALSRGAVHAVFVEVSVPCARAIATNLHALGLEQRAEIRVADAIREIRLRSEGEPFDIIFADPPYASDLPPRIVREVATHSNVLGEEGLVALEHDGRWATGPGGWKCGTEDQAAALLNTLELVTERRYGDKMITILRRPS
ncbi:MAG TPA: 16S rRNA (guanine(966)-N(2))-methyltransferase RsmD [Armatimonadota bacterium]|nr:16S rRNA (guanine(966)-N(2))-methyltransferase RsmD [Armatimonadota bacterium]